MDTYDLHVFTRQERGKGCRNALKNTGKIPGVIYGQHADSVAVAVNQKQLERLLEGQQKGKLLYLIMDDEKVANPVMVKDCQFHPLKNNVMHVDFQRIHLGEKLHASVPIILQGEIKNGVLQQAIRELEVFCLPKDIPEAIYIDSTQLNPGDSVKLSDLQLPAKVELMGEGNEIVLTVLHETKEIVAEPEKIESEEEKDSAKE